MQTITNRALVSPLSVYMQYFQSNIIGYCRSDLVTVSRHLLSIRQFYPPSLNIDVIIVSPASSGFLTLDSVVLVTGDMFYPC